MEKLRDLREGELERDAYHHLSRPGLHLLVDDIGLSFATGTLAGFLYHFIKGDRTASPMGIKSRIYGAALKCKPVGSFLALLSLATNAPSYAVYKLRGQEGRIPLGDAIASAATGTALLCARHGFLFTLAVGASIAVAPAVQPLTTRSLARISETNTYSYPHYRPPQYHHTPSECTEYFS